MTPQQAIRLSGALVALSERGVLLTVGSASFTGLVEPIPPDSIEFQTAASESIKVRIYGLNPGLSVEFGTPPTVDEGTVITGSDGFTYRVASVRREPTDIWTKIEATPSA